MSREAMVGFGFLAVGVFIGAVWLGFNDLSPGVRPWLLVAMAMSTVAGISCFLFLRPKPYASTLADASRDIVAALDGHRDQLECIAALPERLGSSLECIGKRMGDLAHRLDCHGSQLERLITELLEIKQQLLETNPGQSRTADWEESPTFSLDFEHELKVAWKRYQKGGDGHFNAKGFKIELANGGIDADVRSLNDHAGRAVLVIDDPQTSDRSFFVVPDFTKSPKSAEHWFEDESSGELGSRIDELRKLARGRWSNSDSEVVERGSVA